MTTHLNADTVSAFAEGALHEDERVLAEEHLAACAACREEVAWIRTLRDRVSELPDEQEPSRDLWPGIETRIRSGACPPLDAGGDPGGSDGRAAQYRSHEAAGRVGTNDTNDTNHTNDANDADGAHGTDELAAARRRRRKEVGWPGFGATTLRRVAAILLLAGIPASVTYVMTREPAGGSGSAGPGVASGGAEESAVRPVSGAPETVAEAYEPAIRELRDLLEVAREELQPETVAILEENLQIIDGAIERSYAALEADPYSLEAARMLAGMYEAKIQFLRQATNLARGA